MRAGLLIAALLTSICAFCQESKPHPDLSGEWKIDLKYSDFGPFRPQATASLKITQSGDKIQMDVNSGTAPKSLLSLTADGKQHPATVDAQGVATYATTEWREGGLFVILETLGRSYDSQMKSASIHYLSDDGTRLIIRRTVVTRHFKYDQHLEYVRQ